MHAAGPTASPDTGRTASFRDPQLQVLFAVTLMAVLGVASIGPALPLLRRELGAPLERIGLVITMFTLPGIILTPVAGILADRFGRKRVLAPSLVLFGLAGGACALAPTFNALLALRLLQGVGASALGALNVTLIGDLFRGRERTAAMGFNASVLSIGTATYPLIGGGLALLSWHWPFALPLLAVPVAVLVVIALKEPEFETRPRRGSYFGNLWREIRRPAVLALFVASCGIFIMLYGGYITFLPLLMADRFGASSLVIGAVMTSTSGVTALMSSQLGRLARRFRKPTLLRAGFLSFAVGLAVIPFVPAAWAMVVPAAFLGCAFSTTIPVVLTLVADLAPDDRRAAFMAFNGTLLRLGQTLGPVTMTAVFAVGGFTAVFLAASGLAVALALLTGCCIPSRPAEDS